MSAPQPPRVSVIICAHTERRLPTMVAALEALEHQMQRADEIVVVIDRNPALLAEICRRFPAVHAVPNHGPAGAAGARNTGMEVASGEIFAFIDDDAIPCEEWLGRLIAPYADPDVAGVGGASLPLWETGRPAWLPPEFDWAVGCVTPDMPTRRERVRNLWGCNMSLRRSIVAAVGGFDTSLGRVGWLPVGCEETELCIRVAQRLPRTCFLYDPSAVVLHHVPPVRARRRYLLQRCFHEGQSKAAITRMVGREPALRNERAYLAGAIPRALWRDARCAAHGDVAGAGRCAMTAIGLVAAAMGYAAGVVAQRRDACLRRAPAARGL